MPNHYLLPCTGCDHQFELTTSQAGQPLRCPQCDTTVDVPKLGTLKQLPVSNAGKIDRTPAGGATGLKRYVFAYGLIVAVLAGVSGVALYLYSQSLFTPTDIDGHISMVEKELDQYSPVDLWDVWHAQNFDDGMGEWAELNYAKYNKQSEILNYFAYGLLGVSGLGVLALLSSFAMKQ